MTRHQYSNRAKPGCPPDRGVDARATTATGTFEQRPNGRIPTMMIARRLGRLQESPQAVLCLARSVPSFACSLAQNAPMVRRKKIRGHSMPIAPAAGGAL